jgi:AraC-like DNA-binding protein
VAARYDIISASENLVTVVASSGSFDRLGQSTFAFARGWLNCARSLEYLPILSTAQVAKRVGFADATSFRKAYRKWTGHSQINATIAPT